MPRLTFVPKRQRRTERILLAEATAAQRRKFARKVDAIVRDVGRMDGRKAREIMRFLRDARARISDSLTQAQGFDQQFLDEMLRQVELAILEFDARFAQSMIGDIVPTFRAGASIVDLPLVAAGVDLSALPAIDLTQVEINARMSADLISGITADMRRRVNTIISLAVGSGDMSVNQVMRDINQTLKKKTSSEVLRITRTEINRWLNMGTEVRQKQFVQTFPEARKFWLHTFDTRTRASHRRVGSATNPDLGGTPIPVNDKFSVNGNRATGPHDPSLPAGETINCRCRLITVLPEDI